MQLVRPRLRLTYVSPNERRLAVSHHHRREAGSINRYEHLVAGRVVPHQPLRFAEVARQQEPCIPPYALKNGFVLRDYLLVSDRYEITLLAWRRAYALARDAKAGSRH